MSDREVANGPRVIESSNYLKNPFFVPNITQYTFNLNQGCGSGNGSWSGSG